MEKRGWKVIEGYGPGWKRLTLHVNESTGETTVDGSVCIGHEDVDCSCARRLYLLSVSNAISLGKTTPRCGNSRHPYGEWHKATPLPPFSGWLKSFVYWINRKRWGCGCGK